VCGEFGEEKERDPRERERREDLGLLSFCCPKAFILLNSENDFFYPFYLFELTQLL